MDPTIRIAALHSVSFAVEGKSMIGVLVCRSTSLYIQGGKSMPRQFTVDEGEDSSGVVTDPFPSLHTPTHHAQT